MTTTTPPTREDLDQATVDLIFALRDSLTDDGPSRIEFWSGGRAATAILTAAAGSEGAGQAITTAARKLQIPQIASRHAPTIRRIARVIEADYAAWAAHVERHIVYIVALADVQRQTRKDA